MSVQSFPVSFGVEYDPETSTVALVVFAGEIRFEMPRQVIRLRPEHNNPIDALRIIMDLDIVEQEDYDATEARS